MSCPQDLVAEFRLRPVAMRIVKGLEYQGLREWTQMLAESTCCAKPAFLVLVRIFLALMMWSILLWDYLDYFLGVEHLIPKGIVGGGHYTTSFVLLPQCIYLLVGAIFTTMLQARGKGHFRLAHPLMLAASSSLASLTYSTTTLVFMMWCLIDVPRFFQHNPHMDWVHIWEQNHVIAITHTLSFCTTLVDLILVQQPIFIFDCFYAVVYSFLYLIFAHFVHQTLPHTNLDKYRLIGDTGLPKGFVLIALAIVIVGIPLLHVLFWAFASRRSRHILSFIYRTARPGGQGRSPTHGTRGCISPEKKEVEMAQQLRADGD